MQSSTYKTVLYALAVMVSWILTTIYYLQSFSH